MTATHTSMLSHADPAHWRLRAELEACDDHRLAAMAIAYDDDAPLRARAGEFAVMRQMVAEEFARRGKVAWLQDLVG